MKNQGEKIKQKQKQLYIYYIYNIQIGRQIDRQTGCYPEISGR